MKDDLPDQQQPHRTLEALVQRQKGLEDHPMAILRSDAYWDGLLDQLDLHVTKLCNTVRHHQLNVLLLSLLNNQNYRVSNPVIDPLTGNVRSLEDMADNMGLFIMSRLIQWSLGYYTYRNVVVRNRTEVLCRTNNNPSTFFNVFNSLTKQGILPDLEDIAAKLRESIIQIPSRSVNLFRSLLLDMFSMQDFIQPLDFVELGERKLRALTSEERENATQIKREKDATVASSTEPSCEEAAAEILRQAKEQRLRLAARPADPSLTSPSTSRKERSNVHTPNTNSNASTSTSSSTGQKSSHRVNAILLYFKPTYIITIQHVTILLGTVQQGQNFFK